MIRVAIVDDDEKYATKLKGMLTSYGREKGEEFCVSTYTNGLNFIGEYTAEYDMVLMDIDMPHLDGMETAKLLRKMDSRVAVMFVTNLANYAIKGYEVDAVDFIIKPIDEQMFYSKLNRILPKIQRSESEPFVMVTTRLGCVKVYLSEIYYVTVQGRYVLLHTQKGNMEMHVSMKELEKMLERYHFVRGDNSSMVNLMYVTAVTNDGALVNGELIPASRNRRKALLDAFTLYLR